MSKKKNRPDAAPAAQPGHSDPGREVRPSEAPAPSEECEGGAVPLGLPVPLEHYEALQEDAKRRKPPTDPDAAQEDPGGAGDS